MNDHGRWTYAQLDEFSGRIARLLVEEEGLIPGNRVLLRGPNSYTMFAAWLGVLKAGGVVVATMPLLRPGEIATVIDRGAISHAIVDSRFIGDFRQAVEQTHSVKHIIKYDGDFGQGEMETRCAHMEPLPAVDTAQDDPALIAFTSGTTGEPKGCVHFHRDVLAPCDTFARNHFPMKPGDVVLTSAPVAFTFGLGATLLFPLRLGAATATVEKATPPEMLDVVLHHHELLDGSGYPDGLRGDQISDIVRLTTIVDIHAALVEKRAYRLPFTHAKAFAIMEEMGDKLDQHLLQAFRPVALGY